MSKCDTSKVTKQNVIYTYVDMVMPGTPLCRTLEKQFAMQGVQYRMLTTRVSVPHHCVHQAVYGRASIVPKFICASSS